MIKLPLVSIRRDNGPGITVDLIEGHDIYLTFEAETHAVTDEYRLLVPGEARALAAMLVHFADEAER